MKKDLMNLTWREVPLGFVQKHSRSSLNNHTGSWRSMVPVWNFESCVRCGVCALFCPEACITKNPAGFYEANPDYCKGCGICAAECVTRCISMEIEEE